MHDTPTLELLVYILQSHRRYADFIVKFISTAQVGAVCVRACAREYYVSHVQPCCYRAALTTPVLRLDHLSPARETCSYLTGGEKSYFPDPVLGLVAPQVVLSSSLLSSRDRGCSSSNRSSLLHRHTHACRAYACHSLLWVSSRTEHPPDYL